MLTNKFYNIKMYLNLFIKNLKSNNCRKLSTFLECNKAKAWQVHSYGDLSELQISKIRTPRIESSKELIIKVEAASVNPIDLLMLGGYGRTLFQIPRYCEMELPLTLGRDFCGTVIYKGVDVEDTYKIGDEVYGFVPIHKQGSFSDVLIADSDCVVKKPKNLTAVESASLVYCSMTAWSSLFIMGNLWNKNLKGLKILVLGGSGGVGSAAVQLLKSQGCLVYTTCATDAVPLLQSLGATVFDYKCNGYLNEIANEGRYSVILDCAKVGPENLPKNIKYDDYIMLNGPLVKNIDQYGLLGGLAASATDIIQTNLKYLSDRKTIKWGYFLPLTQGLKFIHKLISEGKIKPVIHKEFDFGNLPEAFVEVSNGHLRGKVVINFQNENLQVNNSRREEMKT